MKTAQNVADGIACRTTQTALNQRQTEGRYQPPILTLKGIQFISCSTMPDARDRIYRPSCIMNVPPSNPRAQQALIARKSAPVRETYRSSSIVCPVCKRNMSPPESGLSEEICPGHLCTIPLRKTMLWPDAERRRCCIRMLRCMLSLDKQFKRPMVRPAVSTTDAASSEPAVEDKFCPLCIVAQVKRDGLYGVATDDMASSSIGLHEEQRADVAGSSNMPTARTSSQMPIERCCNLCNTGYSVFDVKEVRVVTDTTEHVKSSITPSRKLAASRVLGNLGRTPSTSALASDASAASTALAAVNTACGSDRKPGVIAIALIAKTTTFTPIRVELSNSLDQDATAANSSTAPSLAQVGRRTRQRAEIRTIALEASDIAILCNALCKSPWCSRIRSILDAAHIPYTPDDYTLDSVTVLPERLRKAYETKDGTMKPSDYDVHAQLIYAANTVNDHWNEATVYRCVAEYLGSEQSRAAQGASPGFTGRHVLHNIRQSFGRKSGSLRDKSMGHRVDYAARAVIGGSTNIAPDCLGVPRCIASSMTVKERVCGLNLANLEARLHDPFTGARIIRIARIVDPTSEFGTALANGTAPPSQNDPSGTQVVTKASLWNSKPRMQNLYFRRDALGLVHSRTRIGVADETLASSIFSRMQSYPRTTPRDSMERSKFASVMATTVGDAALAMDAPGMDEQSIAFRRSIHLQPGDIVERELDDGDRVLFNRQPSLHRLSMMAHRVIIVDGYVLRMNQCSTPPYNADFDGDEMNMHAPQGEHARAETETLTAVDGRSLSPASGAALITLIQDAIVGTALMSRMTTFVTRSNADIIIRSAGLNPVTDLPPAAICGVGQVQPPLWTGKQLMSLAMKRPQIDVDQRLREARDTYEVHVPAGPSVSWDRSNMSVLHKLLSSRAEMPRDDSGSLANASEIINELEYIAEGRTTNSAPSSTSGAAAKPVEVKRGLLIRHSQILCGLVASEEVGKGKTRSLVTAIYKNDPRFGIAFVHRLCRIACTWIVRRGFSVGLSDVYVGPEITERISKLMKQCTSTETLDKLHSIVAVLPYAKRGERIDALLCGKYSEACQASIDLVKRSMREDNALAVMCLAGSKGSWASICATGGCVGQQYEAGQPLKKKMFGPRMYNSIVTKVCPQRLSVYIKTHADSNVALAAIHGRSDRTPLAWGIVASSYMEGLTFDEQVAHHTGSRDGLAGTAIKTQESGKMQRDEVKAMESILVVHDGTVRFPSGQIIQMTYGNDNIDGTRVVLKTIRCFAVPLGEHVDPGKEALDIATAKMVIESSTWSSAHAADGPDTAHCIETLASILCPYIPGDTPATIGNALRLENERLVECISWRDSAPVAAKYRAFKKKQDEFTVPTDASLIVAECLCELIERCRATPLTIDAASRGAFALSIVKRVDDVVRAARTCYGYLTSVKMEWSLVPEHQRSQLEFRNSWVPQIARPLVAHLRESLTIAELVTRTFVSEHITLETLVAQGLFEMIRLRVVERTLRAFDAPGEMVGLICADSNSETLMQLTLNAFHQAGSLVKVLATGLPRMGEITSLSHNQRTPIVTVLLKESCLPLFVASGSDGSSSSTATIDTIVTATQCGLSIDKATALDAFLKYTLVCRCMSDLVLRASVHRTRAPFPLETPIERPWHDKGCIHPADNVMLRAYNLFPEAPPAGCVISETALRLSFRASVIHDLCPDDKYEDILWRAVHVASNIMCSAIMTKDVRTGKPSYACDFIGAISASITTSAAKRKVFWTRIANNFAIPLAPFSHATHSESSASTATHTDERTYASFSAEETECQDDGKTYIAIIRFCLSEECSADERELAECHISDRVMGVIKTKKFSNAVVSGMSSITEASYAGSDPECTMTERRNILLSGQPGAVIMSLLSSRAALQLVDADTISSNDINSIRDTYGIEAARNAIMTELANVHGFDTYVDSRHVTLMADAMSYSGDLTPLNAYHERMHRSVISRATHERPCQEFVLAGLARETCYPTDRSAALIMGSPNPRYGTCLSDVYFSLSVAAEIARQQHELRDTEHRHSSNASEMSLVPLLDCAKRARTEDKPSTLQSVVGGMRRFLGILPQECAEQPLSGDKLIQVALSRQKRARDREIVAFRTNNMSCFTDDDGLFSVQPAYKRIKHQAPLGKDNISMNAPSRNTTNGHPVDSTPLQYTVTTKDGWLGTFVFDYQVSAASYTPSDTASYYEEYDPEKAYNETRALILRNGSNTSNRSAEPSAFVTQALSQAMDDMQKRDDIYARERIQQNVRLEDRY